MKIEHKVDENGQVLLKVTSPKFNHYFLVNKVRDSFAFYEISVSKGSKPKAFAGCRYTSPKKALEDLGSYIKYSTETTTVKRDINTKIREKAKLDASKEKSDNSKQLQQRAAN